MNPKQVSRVSLKPDDIAAIVFWTRNPKPLLRHLDELDTRGLRYYFQYTVLNNPKEIDPKVRRVFNINANHKKDPAQRMACGCVVSRDIGMYDSCLFNCACCYAASSIARALDRFRSHEQTGPSLVPWNAE
jgi:hypothetical protein